MRKRIRKIIDSIFCSGRNCACVENRDKKCPARQQMTISNAGVIHTPSKAIVECCQFQKQLKLASEIVKKHKARDNENT